ncbi:MAG: hypothetical protein KAR87_03515 [Candidatus Aenigmarchaeota archaeon]|nr:hypothetical protein [Candidatus Aenigmarchaeota archaeon]
MKKQKDKDESSLESIRTELSDSGKLLERMSIAVANGLIDKDFYKKTEKKIASDLLSTYVQQKRVDFLESQKSLCSKKELKEKLNEDVKEILKKAKKKVKISRKKILERKKQVLKEEDKKILSDIPVLRELFLRNAIDKKDYVAAMESIEKEHEKIEKQLYDYMKQEDMERLKKKVNALIHRHLKKSLLKKETDELALELSNLEVLFENKLISQELYASKCHLIRNKVNLYESLASKIDVVFDLYSKVVDSVKQEEKNLQKNLAKDTNIQDSQKKKVEEEKRRVINKIKELTAD